MQILLVTDDMFLRGVPRHVGDLASGLALAGHTVVIAASDGPYTERLADPTRFVPVPIISARSGFKNVFGTARTLTTLSRIIRQYHIEVIHSHKRYSDALARIAAKVAGIPHVSTCHNTFRNYKGITRFGNVTIACCNRIRQMLIEDFRRDPDSVQTVYYGMSPLRSATLEETDRLRKSLGLAPRSRMFASVGGLTPAKDRMTLLHSIIIVKEKMRGKNAICIIVGEGPELRRLERFVNANNLGDIVRILPADTDIPILAHLAEFFVLSSIQEGLPYVLLEAACFCKPTIATDVGGVSEFVINNETGILVPPRRPDLIAAAIQSLLDSPATTKKLGEQAKRKFERQHDFQHFIDETLKVYEMALKKTGLK